ncbi:MAG: hypothetical protein AAGB04_00135 [Pseudomonadota bacterium]
MVKEYVGPLYGSEGGRKKYLNKMQQAVDGYMMLLAANRPQVVVSSDQALLGGFAKHFEVAINNMLREIKFERTMRGFVLDAYFCLGIIKVHMADAGILELENNVSMDPGTPFASTVSLDDWVHDMKAKTFDEARYMADMYPIPYEDIKEGVDSGMFSDEATELLRPSPEPITGERVDEISRGNEPSAEEYLPMVWVCDVWLPREEMVYTFPVAEKRSFRIKPFPIASFEWVGPEEGPYYPLSFNDVPGSAMPTSPASHQLFLDQLINNLMRKASRQANRQKDNPVYEPGPGADTMQRLLHASDGEAISSTDPKSVTMIKQGGVDAGNMAFLNSVLGMFDSYAGNLTALLGLGAQSDTVGQEQLIHSAGSKRGAQMQHRVLEATQRVISALGAMLWQDEFKYISGSIELDGIHGKAIQSDWKPGDREGRFINYNFDINVHSTSLQTPAKKAETILMLLSQVYFPGVELMTRGNSPIDFAELTDILADLLNLPRLKSILRPILQDRVDDAPGPQLGKSPVSTRNYVRKSVPSQTAEQHSDAAMQQAWVNQASNSNPQPSA